jgi:wyosine [tRNA(Phe)-imidazoG37] synthetase (radical SAM superfamily)
VLADEQLLGKLPIVLITNGSLVHKREVQRGLAALRERNGVVWYKLDSATEEGAARMNNSRAGIERSRSNLISAAALCPTWIQTMMLAFDGREPSADEQAAYLAFVRALVVDKVPVQGVLLYGLARESHQPEAEQLSALSRAWLEAFARQIEAQGMPVRLFV